MEVEVFLLVSSFLLSLILLVLLSILLLDNPKENYSKRKVREDIRKIKDQIYVEDQTLSL